MEWYEVLTLVLLAIIMTFSVGYLFLQNEKIKETRYDINKECQCGKCGTKSRMYKEYNQTVEFFTCSNNECPISVNKYVWYSDSIQHWSKGTCKICKSQFKEA